jgi:hypothetical protein
MAELDLDDFNVSSTIVGEARMLFDRRFSVPLALTLIAELCGSA